MQELQDGLKNISAILSGAIETITYLIPSGIIETFIVKEMCA